MNTMQQEFDAVVQHLFKQERPATAGYNCLYRTEDGLMCAVGCRIPDETYNDAMEGKTVGDLVKIMPGFLSPEIVEYSGMFDALQCAHDKWAGSESMGILVALLREVAIKYKLTYNSPVGQTPRSA